MQRRARVIEKSAKVTDSSTSDDDDASSKGKPSKELKLIKQLAEQNKEATR